MRYVVLAIALLLTACTDSTVTTEPPDTSQPVAATTTSAAAPPTTTTTTTTTAPPTASRPAPSSQFTALEVPDEELPHTIDDVVIGERGVLLVGNVSPTPRDHPNEEALWHYDGVAWARSLLSDIVPPDEYGPFPLLSNIVTWRGSYLAFVTAGLEAEEALPMVLTSADGRSWDVEPLFARAAAGASFGGIYPTPESPPWPAAAAISSVTATETEIAAVGWVMTGGFESTPALWRSEDAKTWTVSQLPNAIWDNEWAARIAVGEAGWLVTGAGPIHGSGILWFSPDGDDWTSIGESLQVPSEEPTWWSFAEIASGEAGLVVEAIDMGGESTWQTWRSTDGTEWKMVGDRHARPASLASNGKTITRLRQTAENLTVERSANGANWEQVRDLPVAIGEEDWAHRFELELTGDTATLIEYDYDVANYSANTVAVWFDAPVMNVVLVERDDALMVRDGVMAEIIGELESITTGVVTTGRTDGAAGSRWVEILHEGTLGWVNSLYLATPLDTFNTETALYRVTEFVDAVFRNEESIRPYVGPKGLTVTHWEPYRRWTVDPMHDETVYIWGCPECPPDPGPDFHATFADWIAAGFLTAWDSPERHIRFGGPTVPGSETRFWPRTRPEFANMHWLSVYYPGRRDYQDWKEWYVFFDNADGDLVIAGIAADMWIP